MNEMTLNFNATNKFYSELLNDLAVSLNFFFFFLLLFVVVKFNVA